MKTSQAPQQILWFFNGKWVFFCSSSTNRLGSPKIRIQSLIFLTRNCKSVKTRLLLHLHVVVKNGFFGIIDGKLFFFMEEFLTNSKNSSTNTHYFASHRSNYSSHKFDATWTTAFSRNTNVCKIVSFVRNFVEKFVRSFAEKNILRTNE